MIKKPLRGPMTTTDHQEIKKWVDERRGTPSKAEGTGGTDDIGLLRINFPEPYGDDDPKLKPISWDEFFKEFDSRNLALVYEEMTKDGKPSMFYKFIKRNA
jgi:hypothetical protein